MRRPSSGHRGRVVTNPETLVIRGFRTKAEAQGWIVTKLNDRFTRGVLDTLVETPLGVWTVEFKVSDREYQVGSLRTWKQLGLSGLQDERVTRSHVLHGMACVVSGTPDGWLGMWVPVAQTTSPDGQYRLMCVNEDIFKRMK